MERRSKDRNLMWKQTLKDKGQEREFDMLRAIEEVPEQESYIWVGFTPKVTRSIWCPFRYVLSRKALVHSKETKALDSKPN
ncbi:unnamed protein product [Dovyalis caffra]|uniref:Uncharacterized protein n=1 Tax=Dovyalis caffra TaxID=77055 RepID=A0AAV1RDL5_9ROSI|nr:unnamed protein product [Dovyalis caffra]